MKVQAKQLLIALLVVAAMALAAVLGFRWLDRPREFSSLLPSPLSEVTYCSAYLEYGSPDSTSVTLSPEQTQQLLDMLSQPTYHWVGFANSLADQEYPLLRIYFQTTGSERCELMLNGENMLVNIPTDKGDCNLYRMEEDSRAHHAALTAFLEDCLTQNEA